MSGWLVFEVIKGKNLKHHATEVEVSYSWNNEKARGLGSGDVYGLKTCVRTKAACGKVVVALHDKGVMNKIGSLGKSVVGVAEIDVGTGVSEAWVDLTNGQGTLLVSWRYTFFEYGGMFDEAADDTPPPEPTPYALKLLQAEVLKISNHGYSFCTPYWWLSQRFFWTYPLESALLLTLGSFVFYHNLTHIAFPATLLAIMSLNFVKKFRGLPIQPEVEALGWMKTLEWVSQTLKMTQNLLAMTNDSLDYFSEMFTWENQDTSRVILVTCLVAMPVSYFGYLQWTYIFLVVWVYMFTYYPLGYLAPQLYRALLPSTYLSKGVGGDAGSKSAKDTSILPIEKMTIPRQEKRQDNRTYFEIVLTFTNNPNLEESLWYRYSDFAALRTKLDLIDHSIAIRGFPGKTAFALKGEALNARRRDLEAWLAMVIEQSKKSRGAAWRPALRAFLMPSKK
eukprot:TRINITY_DN14995_c0_g1_i1.p1 TRINITY_DN14995_c0_g1~~TRINITY_DN14995_c0_g1_i1.p1  ORF type:complete len:463 (+),score=100.99 TRINITY_DN14995_c0_g1_i1:41-1390(+)